MNSPSWHIPRRTFLRGLGTAVALPVLDAMLPTKSFGATGSSGLPAAKNFPKRIAWVYVPNGKNMADWTPAATGANYELPSILEPLAKHRSDFTLLLSLIHI